jgi:hypothetical protein
MRPSKLCELAGGPRKAEAPLLDVAGPWRLEEHCRALRRPSGSFGVAEIAGHGISRPAERHRADHARADVYRIRLLIGVFILAIGLFIAMSLRIPI